MPDPNLVVSLLTPDEAPQYMRIRHETFVHDVNKILYSNNNGEASEKTLEEVTEGIRDGIINKGIIYLKCVDTKTGEMIAGARWRYVRPKDPNAKERTWEEVDEGLNVPPMYNETHPEVWNGLYDLFNANRREHMGTRPYYSLDTLATHPNHHRRGAGGLLLTWGCEKADAAGVEAYLEASSMGAPLYARYGFQPIRNVSLDLRRWGGDVELEWTLMRRPAKLPTSSSD